jgi:hypothetical protein
VGERWAVCNSRQGGQSSWCGGPQQPGRPPGCWVFVAVHHAWCGAVPLRNASIFATVSCPAIAASAAACCHAATLRHQPLPQMCQELEAVLKEEAERLAHNCDPEANCMRKVVTLEGLLLKHPPPPPAGAASLESVAGSGATAPPL